MKRSVVFPADVNDILKEEAKRQGISFNKVVVQACLDKYDPDSYDAEIANRADGGLREVKFDGDTTSAQKEIKISGEDAVRLEEFAAEARLTVAELIRKFARFGKVSIVEVKIPGVDRWTEYSVPLMEELQFLINRIDNMNEETELVSELSDKTEELLKTMKLLRKNFFYTKRRFNKKFNAKGKE